MWSKTAQKLNLWSIQTNTIPPRSSRFRFQEIKERNRTMIQSSIINRQPPSTNFTTIISINRNSPFSDKKKKKHNQTVNFTRALRRRRQSPPTAGESCSSCTLSAASQPSAAVPSSPHPRLLWSSGSVSQPHLRGQRRRRRACRRHQWAESRRRKRVVDGQKEGIQRGSWEGVEMKSGPRKKKGSENEPPFMELESENRGFWNSFSGREEEGDGSVCKRGLFMDDYFNSCLSSTARCFTLVILPTPQKKKTKKKYNNIEIIFIHIILKT